MAEKRTRTPRDHDAAIRALRREALCHEKMAQDAVDSGPRAFHRFVAASLTSSAEYIASIVGKVERKEKS